MVADVLNMLQLMRTRVSNQNEYFKNMTLMVEYLQKIPHSNYNMNSNKHLLTHSLLLLQLTLISAFYMWLCFLFAAFFFL